MRFTTLAATLAFALAGCGGDAPQTDQADASRESVNAFLVEYAKAIKPKWTEWQTLAWKAHTRVRMNDVETAELASEARDAWELAVADQEWAHRVRELLRAADDTNFADQEKTPPTKLQLESLRAVQEFAQNNQQRASEDRKAARAQLASLVRQQATWTYSIKLEDEAPDAGEEAATAEAPASTKISRSELIGRLGGSADLEEREAYWNALVAPARSMKVSYPRLRDARNALAKKQGHKNHLDASFSRYDMTADEMQVWLHEVEVAIRPLYRELHTWMRHELAARYDAEVPEYLPVHWLGGLGTNFSGSLELASVNPAEGLADRGQEGMLQDAAAYFQSMGLAPLPDTVWANSDLYPRTSGDKFGKLGGSAVWNVDLGTDVRILLSANATPDWMHRSYRELSTAHALVSRANGSVPTPLRMQSPDALIGALGVWSDFAGTRPARLEGLGQLPPIKGGEMDELLHDAVIWFSSLPFLTGTIASFERDIYVDGLQTDQLNTRWWSLVQEHQGIVPPGTRTERWADALNYAPLIANSGSATEDVIALVVGIQLHYAAAANLALDPHTTDFAGRAEAGEMFRQFAVRTASEDWREVVNDLTGGPPSADSLVSYFEPLQTWLEMQNDGRIHTMPRLK